MRFFSDYFICHFYFLQPKIMGKTFMFIGFIFDYVFHFLHYQFFIIIFPKPLVIWLLLEFLIFFFNSLFSSFNTFISASFLIFAFFYLLIFLLFLFLIFLLLLFLIFLLLLFLIFLLFLLVIFLLFLFLIFLLVLCLFLFPF